MHVDTTWKFGEMIEFREKIVKDLGLELIVHINQDGVDQGIGPFSHGFHTVLDKTLGVLTADFVLGGAGDGDIARHVPGPFAGVVVAAEMVGVLGDPAAAFILEFHQPGQLFRIDAVGVVDIAVRIAGRHHLGTELRQFLDGELSHIPRTGDRANLAVQAIISMGQHVLQKVDNPITRRLTPDQTAAVGQALPRHHPDPLVHDSLVLTEHETDLTRADTNVSGRDVGTLADVPLEFGDE